MIAPPGGDRIPANTGVTISLEVGEVGLPHLFHTVSGKHGIADELVWLTGSVTTDFTFRVPGPEWHSAFFTDFADKSFPLEIFKLIFILKHEEPLTEVDNHYRLEWL